MPKVFITQEQQLNNRLATLIYGLMKIQNKSQKQMADKLSISQPAFGKKLKRKQFTFLDLVTIFDELGFTDEQILSVMKRGKYE